MFEDRGNSNSGEPRSGTRRAIVRQAASNTRQITVPQATSGGRSAVSVEFVEEKSFREYFLTISRYRYLILFFALLGFALASVYNYRAVRLYGSSALVNIGSYIPVSEGAISRDLREDTTKGRYVETQIALLRSFKLAERVLRGSEEVRVFLSSGGETISGKSDPETFDYASGLGQYLGMISVEDVKATTLVKISAITKSPQASARIVNQHAEEFIKMVLEERKRKAQITLSFIQKQVDEAKARLAQVRERKLLYAKAHPAIAANSDALQRSFETKYSSVMAAMNQAAELKSIKGAEARALDRKNAEEVAAGVGELNQVMSVEKLRSEYESWRKVLKNDQHPYLTEYKRQIKVAELALDTYARQHRETADLAYRLSRDREAMLKTEFEKLAAQEREQSVIRVEYDALMLEEAVAKEEFDKLNERLSDASLNTENEQKNVVLEDPGMPNSVPVLPKQKANAIKGTLLGLLLGMVLSFLLDVSDSSVRTIADLERLTDLHVLGIVPRIRRNKAAAAEEDETAAAEPPEQAEEGGAEHEGGSEPELVRELILVKQRQSRESEAIRSILISITGAQAHDDPRIILVTSSEKGEGKTTFAANLAVALAESGEQTVLIDADLRLPVVHQYFGLGRDNAGVVEFINDKTTVFEAVHETGVPNLSAMTAGKEPQSPTYCLRSPKMGELLAQLAHSFDYVIVDSPPVGAVSDALVLARHVHGVVMVVRCKTTPRHMVTTTIERLNHVGAPMLGIVLNDVEKSSGRETYGYYSESYYSSGPKAGTRRTKADGRSASRSYFALPKRTGRRKGSRKSLGSANRLNAMIMRRAGLVALLGGVFLGGIFVSRLLSRSPEASAPEPETISPREDNGQTVEQSAAPAAGAAIVAPTPAFAPAATTESVLPPTSDATPPAETAAPVIETIQDPVAAMSAGPTAVPSPIAAPAPETKARVPEAVIEPISGPSGPLTARAAAAAEGMQATGKEPQVISGLDSLSGAQAPGTADNETAAPLPAGWYIQLGFSRSKDVASRYRDFLHRGPDVPVEVQYVSRAGIKFYRVLVGPAKTKGKAKELIKALRGYTDPQWPLLLREVRAH